MLEQATEEPVSDGKTEDNSVSFSDIILICIGVGIIGAIIIVYNILAQKKLSDSSITQTALNKGESITQSLQIVSPLSVTPPF